MSETEPTHSCYGDLVIVRDSAIRGTVRVGPPYVECIGHSNEELALRPLVEWIHPEDRAAVSEALLAGKGAVRARHQTQAGGWISLDWRIKADSDGVAALGLKHEAGASLPESQPASLPSERQGLGHTLEAMARIVEAQNPGMMCSILLVDKSGDRITVGAGPSLPAEYNAAVEGLRIGPTVGSCGTAAFWNVPVAVEDIAADPLWKDLRAAAKIAGVAACWSHPVSTAEGQVLGAMALYSVTPSAPARHHMDGLEIAARMVAVAVERDRLEERLSQSAKMEALGVLAGGIAHDFNNILSAILGNAELALESLTQGAVGRPFLQAVKTASVNAADLCSQMLAYAGRGGISAEPVECNRLVRELGGLLRVALAKKAELKYELNGQDLWVSADPSQLRQVIINLITNASEAIGNNPGVITVGTRLRANSASELATLASGQTLEPGEYVQLWVSDTGSGIDAESREKIFDPFYSTKSAGRGLGLAAVQGIVRRHSGAITLVDGAGDGTQFSVLLPRALAPSLVAPAPIAERRKGLGKTILVVDDEPAVLNVVAMMLKSVGYEVLRARDGVEAIQKFTSEWKSVDCVLLDLSMPKLDGDEVLRELRLIRGDIPVILMSGFTEQQVLTRVQDAGLAGVLPKPVLMDTLLSKVAMALGDKADPGSSGMSGTPVAGR